MERRSVQAIFDCEVVINEISMAAIRARRERWVREEIARGHVPRFTVGPLREREVHDSALLQEALRNEPASLDAWLIFEVATVLDIEGIPEAAPPRGEEERILTPLIESLPPEQRHRLREAMATGALIERLDEFFSSFDVNIHGIELRHVDRPATSPGWIRSRPTLVRSGGRDGTTERRRVRAVLDCEVGIRDITRAAIEARRAEWLREQIAEGYGLEYIPDTPSEREVEDVGLLQEALRADPARLDAWVLHEVAMMFAIEGLEEAEPPEGEEERILGPVIESLPPAQRHRFREALAKDRLVEPAGEFYNSFHPSVRGAEFELVGGTGEEK